MPEGDLEKRHAGPVSPARMDESSFDTERYLETYYPPIPNVEQAAAIAREMQSVFNGDKAVDVSVLASQTGMGKTLLENIAILDFQCHTARKLLEKFPRGDALILDMGAGPTIHQHIPMSMASWHITHSDFLPKNRTAAVNALQDLKGERWDSYLALTKDLLGKDTTLQSLLQEIEKSSDTVAADRAAEAIDILSENGISKLKERVRESVNEDVVHGDLFRDDLGLPDPAIEVYDAITSYFALESATGERDQWEAGLAHVAAKLKPGGLLVMAALRNADWYLVGQEKVPAVSLTEDDVRKKFEEVGLAIEEIRITTGSDKEQAGFDGLIFVIGRKRE